MTYKVLITGGNGFIGKVLVSGFKGALTLGRHNENQIICDLSIQTPTFFENFDIIIHNAGKAHSIPKNKIEEQEFFDVNTKGTQNVLNSIEPFKNKIKQFVLISTVAVYGLETGKNINENSPLKGNTPYALSKIEAEKLVWEWGKKNNIPTLIFRLPLVVGENPPGNLGRMIEGIRKGKYFRIKKGKARRSVFFADDLNEIIKKNIGKFGIYNLSDGINPSFFEIERKICQKLNIKDPKEIPVFLALILSKLGDIFKKIPFNSSSYLKMTNDLTFDSSRAEIDLNFKPTNALDRLNIN